MAEYIVIEVADENGVFADVRKPLIRCKDCRYFGNKVRIHDTYVCNKLGVYMPMDGYCSEGKQNESS